MEQVVTEMRIGGTLYIVTSECSPSARETVEQKLERIICRHAKDTISYQSGRDKPLAMCEKQSEYTADTMIEE